MPRPHANCFTSAEAILGVLDRLDERGTVTVREVMADVPCCEKQGRDYLAFLERRGLVTRTRRGRTDEYRRVVEAQPQGGSVTMAAATGSEFAVAVLGALRGTAFHEAAVNHIMRLRVGLGSHQGPRAARLRSAFYAVRGSVPLNEQLAENAEEILDALMHAQPVKASYELLSTGEVRDYDLVPLGIVVHHHDGLHLVARREDGQVRTFDVEGFRAIERVRGRSTPPPAFNLGRYFANAFGRYTDFPVRKVVLRLHGEAARQLRRRSFHPSQAIDSDDGTEVMVSFRIGICPEFTSWVLGLAPAAEVVEPPDLREEVLRRSRATAAANVTGSR